MRVFQTLLTQRHYDSYSAKFLARDPIGYGGGLNLCGYADGNPITNFDPSGDADARHAPDPNEDVPADYHQLLGEAGQDFVSQRQFQAGSPEREKYGAMIAGMATPLTVASAGYTVATGHTPIGGGKVGASGRVLSLLTMILGLVGIHAGGAPTAGDEIALGTSSDGLPSLRTAVPHAKDFKALGLSGLESDFGDQMLKHMQTATALHFSLDGINDIQYILSKGAGLVKGSTNWELRTIWDNPGLKNKTTFYLYGKVISPQSVGALP